MRSPLPSRPAVSCPVASRSAISRMIVALLCVPLASIGLTTASAGAETTTARTLAAGSRTADPAADPAAAAAAGSDPFYIPPKPLPAGRPGTVIRSRPMESPNGSAKGWHILYLSTDVRGARIAVSGTVLAPKAAYRGPGPRPLVAYASGTQGWGDQCAPSKSMVDKVFDEQFAVDNLLGRGWAVVVTDYPGLGTPGAHLYNIGIAEGHAVLDSLRAAQNLPAAKLSRKAKVAIEGYSQGGGAAGWAAEQHRAYAPELRLAGVAGGGIPSRLQTVAENINGSLVFGFLAGTAVALDAAYPELKMDSYLTAEGKAAVQKLGGMCQIEGLITYAGKRIEDYTIGRVNPINRPDWKAVLDANALGRGKPGAPFLAYHGLLDEVIPTSAPKELHRKYCAMGVAGKLNFYAGDHPLTHVFAQADVVNWLADRIAGKPAPDNC